MKENTLEHKLTREVRSTMNNSSGTGAAAPAAVGMSRFTYTVTSDDVNMTVKLVLKKRLNFSRRLLTKLKQGGGREENRRVSRRFECGSRPIATH